MSASSGEFSAQTREAALGRLRSETFDLLVIGGGITGAATARDAASRGLKVAVVEMRDFAWGTSSRSSKLIHGGLRYLQNFEFGLVFEALSERAHLLKSAPHMVKPLPFVFPVFDGDPSGRTVLSFGLWLYDLLALFRAPGFHKSLSRDELLEQIPFLKTEGLLGGFRYFDASMWDDMLAVETLRSAHFMGAAVANYVQAVGPRWEGDRITGFRLRDLNRTSGEGEIDVSCHRVVVCAGPWTDQVGMALSPSWKRWLTPSKGVHIVLDLKRVQLPGAMVMNHPEDGRIAFVIPRPDLGAGVVIVGTTDGPTSFDPDRAEIESGDVKYLMELLNKYFPALELTNADILSGYVGVRPLMGSEGSKIGAAEPDSDSSVLQKVSREHHIALGPGGAVIVAGGKYTTHRKMAEEIVDFTLKAWMRDARSGDVSGPSVDIARSSTKAPVNLLATARAVEECRVRISALGLSVPEELFERYGAAALEVAEIARTTPARGSLGDPEGFPLIESQLRYSMRAEMVMHLEDFFFRRVPFYLSRRDHGLPWVDSLACVWAEELGLGEKEALAEASRVRAEIERRSAWMSALVSSVGVTS